jgi:hypothetical protein
LDVKLPLQPPQLVHDRNPLAATHRLCRQRCSAGPTSCLPNMQLAVSPRVACLPALACTPSQHTAHHAGHPSLEASVSGCSSSRLLARLLIALPGL